LDIQSEGLSDSESNDDNLNNKSRKIRWNWTIVFVRLFLKKKKKKKKKKTNNNNNNNKKKFF